MVITNNIGYNEFLTFRLDVRCNRYPLYDHLEYVKLFLTVNNVDINAKDTLGMTPLSLALLSNNSIQKGIPALLPEHGAIFQNDSPHSWT